MEGVKQVFGFSGMSMEKWPQELLLVRHGQSEANVRKETARAQGKEPAWTDIQRDQDTPLTPLGNSQAIALGKHLRSLYPPAMEGWYPSSGVEGWYKAPLDYIIMSPYVRTRQTTARILEGMDYPAHAQPLRVVVEERIREIEFGIMDGIDRQRFRELFPSEAARRDRDGKYWFRPPGGENRPDVRLRVHSILDTLNRDYVGSRVLVVCHSVVVLAFRSLLERWDEAEYLMVDKEDDVKNCGLTRYIREDGRRLKLVEYNTVIPHGVELA
jgi:broad specificity phosphatase PhoE